MKKKSLVVGVVLVGALAVAGVVAGLVFRTDMPAEPSQTGGTDVEGNPRIAGTDATSSASATRASTGGEKPTLAADGSGPDAATLARRQEVLDRRDPDAPRLNEADPLAVKDRPPGPVPEAGIGPDHSEKWSAADAVLVEQLQVRISEKPLTEIRWNRRSLKAAAEELGRLGDVLIEVEGEDLADEPVTFEGEGFPVMDVLMRIAQTRNLRFQIRPDKIVIKR
jgi:hypothetical protein